jgi:hypothetical protein
MNGRPVTPPGIGGLASKEDRAGQLAAVEGRIGLADVVHAGDGAGVVS